MAASRKKGAGGSIAGLRVLGQPPPVKERKDAARNRLRILEAARALLAERPMQEICMDELAQKAGVGKGTLYRRFADRAALCHALLDDDATALQNAALAFFGAPMGAPWLPHAARLLDALFDFAVDHASLLAEARSFERGPARFEHPAHRWQRDTLRLYLGHAVGEGECEPMATSIAAEFMLAPLDPDLLMYHMQRGLPREIMKAEFRRHWRSGVQSTNVAE